MNLVASFACPEQGASKRSREKQAAIHGLLLASPHPLLALGALQSERCANLA
jgi:hypothetical protein